MDSDEDTDMIDVESLSSLGKGKGKAIESDVAPEADNLPWYFKNSTHSTIT